MDGSKLALNAFISSLWKKRKKDVVIEYNNEYWVRIGKGRSPIVPPFEEHFYV